jgi:hypothetical protein
MKLRKVVVTLEIETDANLRDLKAAYWEPQYNEGPRGGKPIDWGEYVQEQVRVNVVQKVA